MNRLYAVSDGRNTQTNGTFEMTSYCTTIYGVCFELDIIIFSISSNLSFADIRLGRGPQNHSAKNYLYRGESLLTMVSVTT